MCTLIVYFRCQADLPLLLALNRDEYLERPTAAVAAWRPDATALPILSGRDLRSGGTWFGIGRHVIAGLTNHRPQSGRSLPGSRSRGDLVVNALQRHDLAAVRADMERLPMQAYGPFHLLAVDVDADSMLWFSNRDGTLEVSEVQPGLHILGNFGLDHQADPVVAHLQQKLGHTTKWPFDQLLPHLQQTLAEHGPGRPCIHREGYGTRSSTIYARHADTSALWLTDAPPCQQAFEDHTSRCAIISG